MTKYTQQYHLKKPGEEDLYDISDHNGNMDILDTTLFGLEQQLGQAADKITLDQVKNTLQNTDTTVQTINTKLGSTSDTGNSTLMGKVATLQNSVNIVQNKGKMYVYDKDAPYQFSIVSTKNTFPITAKVSGYAGDLINFKVLGSWTPEKSGYVVAKCTVSVGPVTVPDTPSSSGSGGGVIVGYSYPYSYYYVYGGVTEKRLNDAKYIDFPVGTVGIQTVAERESPFDRIFSHSIPKDLAAGEMLSGSKQFFVDAGVPMNFYMEGSTNMGARDVYCYNLDIHYTE